MINTLSDETNDALSTLQYEIRELKTQVNLLVITVGNASGRSRDRGEMAKVSKPKRYEGVRNAKELENFLFDMEQYFRAVCTESEEDKMAMASMYLTRDAKLWWCSKFINAFSVICIANVETPPPHTIVKEAKEKPARMGSIRFLSTLQALH
ncbi:Uncharacterized protein TCM_022987 [Theobroma cacao]|uniref:Senescence-specific cysteine protease sag39 n=1 Tax=Theobroma cacao TaxID=3641 RepID=A0A061EV17_THECC|nr:Uncharacterized protein TCM_022987 [Theobroma cacao]